jgi:hypothetical protein
MYKDKTKLFQTAYSQFITSIVCIVLLVLSLIFIIKGNSAYKRDIRLSSSPVGTNLQFTKSNADLTISGLYTDEKNSVLIARLTPNSSARLPFKGADFNVFLASDPLNKFGNQKTDILFGRLGVDGDFFLIIPKPLNDVYTIAIANKKYFPDFSSSDSKDSKENYLSKLSITEPSQTDEQMQKSVTATLSQIKPMLEENSNSQLLSLSAQNNSETDMITFRMGLNTAKDEEKYKPIVLKGELLKGTKFQFEPFFNQVFKEEALKQLNASNIETNKQKSQLEKVIKDYEERLLIEPDSGETIKAKKDAESKLTKLNDDQAELADKLAKYDSLTYTPDYFANLNNKATIIDASKYSLGGDK